MKIWTAWVEVEGSYEVVASADADYYSGGYFDLELERKFFDYDQEPRLLCLEVEDSLIAELFTDGDTDRPPHLEQLG